MSSDPKLVFAFVNGIYKGYYENDAEMTVSFLKEQIFPDEESLTIEVLSERKDKILLVLKKAAQHDWELSALESFLKEEDTMDLTKVEVDAVLKLWKMNKGNIHESLYNNTKWNNSYEKLSWRIDSKVKTRNSTQDHNELYSIVELVTGDVTKQSKVIRFEMNREDLNGVVAQLDQVEKFLSSFAGQ